MCGIAGLFAVDASAPPIDRAELMRIDAAQAIRGPDGHGSWIDDDQRIGLAHRRLAIIDLTPSGAQPMTIGNGDYWISYNGEIYNHAALRLELESQGERCDGTSDTEVLLRLYRRHGAAMLPRLRGMFALAIWDRRQRCLFLARDPLGIKPLYYTAGPTFRFASQVKALIAGGGIESRLSAAGQASFLVLGYVADPHTIEARVAALPAGCWMAVRAGQTPVPVPYFSLNDLFAEAAEAPPSAAALRDVLAEALADSVEHHFVGDVPVGLFLSAGLDSASVAALACTRPGTLRSLTLGFEEYRNTARDEVGIAELVARSLGAEHRTAWITRRDFQDDKARFFAAMDQPTVDGINIFLVSRAARQAGLKVALSGIGGDELFGGYPSFRQIPNMVCALGFLRPLPAIGQGLRRLASPLLPARLSPKYAGMLEYGTSLEDAYLLRRGLFMPWELPGLMGPDSARSGWEALDLGAQLARTTAGIAGDHARIAALEMSWYMRNQLLRDTDWAGMASSVEVRTPLVDVCLLRRLAPLLLGDPPVSKRDMVRATAAGRIGALLDRPKSGFEVPVREWLLGTRPGGQREHGHRGWARHVLGHFTDRTRVAAAS